MADIWLAVDYYDMGTLHNCKEYTRQFDYQLGI